MATQPSCNLVSCEATFSLPRGDVFVVLLLLFWWGEKKNYSFQPLSLLLAINRNLLFICAANQVLKTSFKLIEYPQNSS